MEKLRHLFLIYETAIKSRYLDEQLQKLTYDKIATRLLFSSIGTEVGMSMIAHILQSADYLVPRYRGYAALLGRGVPLHAIIAEVLRRESGTAKGIGDSSPFHDFSNNVYGYSTMLGTSFSTAVGLALASKIKKEERMTTHIFGDGEASRSTFGSALNLSSVWQLPLLFVCENNRISIRSKIETMSSTSTIAERAKGYNVDHATISETTDSLHMFELIKDICEYVRKNRKPFLLEILQTRYNPHSSIYDKTPTYGDVIPVEIDSIMILEKKIISLGLPKSEIEKKRRATTQIIDLTIKKVLEEAPVTENTFRSIYHV